MLGGIFTSVYIIQQLSQAGHEVFVLSPSRLSRLHALDGLLNLIQRLVDANTLALLPGQHGCHGPCEENHGWFGSLLFNALLPARMELWANTLAV